MVETVPEGNIVECGLDKAGWDALVKCDKVLDLTSKLSHGFVYIPEGECGDDVLNVERKHEHVVPLLF